MKKNPHASSIFLLALLLGAAPAFATKLQTVTPNLGDTYGGAPLTLTGTGLSGTTSVTIGGAPCTSIVNVSSTKVTCVAPAKAAGSYDVVLTASGGSSTLRSGYEAWSPVSLSPKARVYQSDQGVTTAGAVPGTWYSWDNATTNAPWHPRDGAQLLYLNTNLFLLGGWFTGAFTNGNDTCNEVWRSSDGGTNWTKILADDDTQNWQTGARWRRRHMAGCVVQNNLLYIIGGDPLDSGWPTLPTDVWSSSDGSNWTRRTTFAQWGPRTHHMAATFKGNLYVMGGQTNAYDVTTAMNDVWMSSDGGSNWTCTTANAGWLGRGLVSNPVEFNGKLWLVGGGTYNQAAGGVGRTYYNDVWNTSDGTNWTQVLVNGLAPWEAREYHNLVVFNNRLWLMAGYNTLNGNHNDVWSSPDGTNWTQNMDTPWLPTHAAGVTVGTGANSNMLYKAAGNAMWQDAWQLPNTPGRDSAVAVSQWNDLGAGGLNLSQGNAGAQPFKFNTTFGAQPGIEVRGDLENHFMMLAAPDRGITAGCFQIYVVGKTKDARTWGNYSPSAIDPISTMVGATNSSTYNEFGMSTGVLEYHDGSIAWHTTQRGSGLNDGQSRLLWAQHQNASLKLGVGTVQQGTTDTAVGFDTTWVGWDSLGAGIYTFDKARFTYGAVVVIPDTAIASTNLTKLNKWAVKWGNIAQ